MIRQKQCVKAEYVKECEGVKEETEGEEEEGRQKNSLQFLADSLSPSPLLVLLPLQGQLAHLAVLLLDI